MAQGKIIKVAGSLIVAEGMSSARMFDVVRVSKRGLIGEILEMRGDRANGIPEHELAGAVPGDDALAGVFGNRAFGHAQPVGKLHR